MKTICSLGVANHFLCESQPMQKLVVHCRLMSCMSGGEQKKSLKEGGGGGRSEEEPSPTRAFQKTGEKSNFSQERAVKKDKDILGL